jgi:hypothetical protein
LAACNRFGVDNPCPIISKKLTIFGNTDDLASEYRKAVMRLKETFK